MWGYVSLSFGGHKGKKILYPWELELQAACAPDMCAGTWTQVR